MSNAKVIPLFRYTTDILTLTSHNVRSLCKSTKTPTRKASTMTNMASNNGLTAEERLESVHQWYLRFGFPMKPAMKKKVTKTVGCDISVDDIDLLPWNKTGTRVDMQQLLLSISMHSTSGSYPDQSESTDNPDQSESTDMTESFGWASGSGDDNSFSMDEETESEAADAETLIETGKYVDINEVKELASLIHDVFDPDPSVVQSTLDTLQKSIDEDLNIEDKSLRTFERLFVAAGGCKDSVLLLKEQLSTVTHSLPMSTLIPDFKEIDDAETAAELKILSTAIKQVCTLTCAPCDPEETIRVEFVKRGCVKVVVKAMRKFPRCAELQWDACIILWNLLQSSEGRKSGLKAGAMGALLTAVKNHPAEYHICNDALDTLGTLIEGSLSCTRRLMGMDAVTVASRALDDWPADSDAHGAARRLLGLFVTELNALLSKSEDKN
jgi:hypothetical protein